eukprot:m.25544 g.25544  ORF g.25544 m.25544 type:complete len:140 (+) comp13579_c1_seq2:43-462(+)
MSASSSSDVNIAELKFPPELTGDDCVPLFNAEVQLLLEARKNLDEDDETESNLAPMFQKTLAYCERFGHFKNTEAVKEVRNVLVDKGLHSFEQAALANLCPENADEAKTLIPSLKDRIDDEELAEILQDIQSFRNHQFS